jgi:hypothetical protein
MFLGGILLILQPAIEKYERTRKKSTKKIRLKKGKKVEDD